MTSASPASRWRSPGAVGLLVGLVGFGVAGTVGAVVGVVAGAVATRRAQAVLVAAAAALLATAAFTVLEQPGEESRIPEFPLSYPLAEFSATLAAVLLLAGLTGMAASGGAMRRARSEQHGSQEARKRGWPMDFAARPAFMAAFGFALLATLVLWQVGDRWWASAAPALGITILGLGALLLLVRQLRWRPGRWLAPMPGPVTILDALRREHPHMLGGSAWLLAATVAVSLGSFAFWLLATQRAPAEDVGRAAALFSASMFLCYLTSLGLPVAVSRYAADGSEGSATLFAWSLLLRVTASLAAVALFVVFAPDPIREALATTHPGFAWLAVFGLVAGQSVAELVDVRLMALRRWSLVFIRSCLIAVGRLPFLLWVPAVGGAFYLYMVALGGFAITGVAFLPLLARRGWLRLRPLPTRARRAAQFAGVNYLGQLAVQAPFFAVPFVVLVQVSAVENASFYLSWGVMSVVYISVQMLGQALLVEGGRGGADHRRQAAVALGIGLACTVAATVLSLGLGPLLARVYGPAYGPVGTLLPLLVAGTIPFAVTMTVLTASRIREHSNSTIAVAVGFAVAVLVPTVFLTASYGALGAAWGWTVGNTLAAVFALLASRMYELGGRERGRSNQAPLATRVPGWQRGSRDG
jgi:O-antigen/teichoic acid export membrane protein